MRYQLKMTYKINTAHLFGQIPDAFLLTFE